MYYCYNVSATIQEPHDDLINYNASPYNQYVVSFASFIPHDRV